MESFRLSITTFSINLQHICQYTRGINKRKNSSLGYFAKKLILLSFIGAKLAQNCHTVARRKADFLTDTRQQYLVAGVMNGQKKSSHCSLKHYAFILINGQNHLTDHCVSNSTKVFQLLCIDLDLNLQCSLYTAPFFYNTGGGADVHEKGWLACIHLHMQFFFSNKNPLVCNLYEKQCLREAGVISITLLSLDPHNYSFFPYTSTCAAGALVRFAH